MTKGQFSPSKFVSFQTIQWFDWKVSCRPYFRQHLARFLAVSPSFPIFPQFLAKKRLTPQPFLLNSQSEARIQPPRQWAWLGSWIGAVAWAKVNLLGPKLSSSHLLASSQPPYTLETSRLNPDSLTHVSKSILETHQGRNYTQFTHIYPYLYSIYPYLPIFIN